MEGEVRAVVTPATQVVAGGPRPISVYRPIGQYHNYRFQYVFEYLEFCLVSVSLFNLTHCLQLV